MAKLNHIGIAVSDRPALEKLLGLLGLRKTHTESVPEQGVVAHFLPVAAPSCASDEIRLELLEVTDPQGTVAKFIAKRGPGIHHLSFELVRGELEPLCGRLRSEGFRLIYDSPRCGAHQMRINFIHPASANGILIELMEPA